MILGALLELSRDVTGAPGPWSHYRASDGALVLEDSAGEPLAQLYAGLPLARLLEAVAPAVLLLELEGGQ